MESLQIRKDSVELRQLNADDATELARLANDKSIFDNVRDYFPYPYSLKNAYSFINQTMVEDPVLTFAICYKKELAGMIGIKQQSDIYRKSGEVGYWLGAPYRGMGVATSAVALITDYGLKILDLNRLYAGVFATNPASMKVLEKCGYLREGIARNAVWKNGQFLDEYRYAFVK